MEEFPGNAEQAVKAQWMYEEQLSLVQLEVPEQSSAALQRALPRIRRSLRGTDMVYFQGKTCAIVLPATPITGAQVVARRLASLLIDVEYTTHVLFGAAARTALSRLRFTQALEVPVEIALTGNDTRRVAASPSHYDEPSSGENDGADSLPHLAYLSHYPSLRLFHLFPYALARRYQCVPVGVERSMLTLATCQRLPAEVIAHLQEEIRRTIFQVYCEMSIIEDVLRYWERMLPVTVGPNYIY